ncbi:MAG TPA: nucleotide exchange factor GrpE [Candidatus Paceibacterota bacterium]
MSKQESEKKESADRQIGEDFEIVAESDEEKSSFGKKPQDMVKDLKEKLKVCEGERQEFLDGWQRAKADFINARKEEEKARGEFKKFANEDLLLHILSVMDSFEMAFSNKEAWEKAPQEWRIGVEYIYSQLKKILEGHGLLQLHSIGERFNPIVHESVELVPIDDAGKDGVIVDVVSSGYSLHGKVVRVPRVKVGSMK